MNKVILQLWEEFSVNGYLSNGGSLHLDRDSLLTYVNQIYSSRRELGTSSDYDRVVSGPIDVYIDDQLFLTLKSHKSIKLSQVELRNLLNLEEIIYNPETV